MRFITCPYPGRLSRLILHIELPLTLLQAVVFLISYLHVSETEPVRAISLYAPLVPYLFFPLLITAFSVLLIERFTGDRENDRF